MSFDDFRDRVRGGHGLESQPPAAEPDEGLDLTKYLSALRRRWPLVIICCALAASYALLRYSLTTKEYRATAMIQIERKRLSVMALGQANWLEDWWNMEYYPTQYRLLRSRGMAERVVLNLRLHEDPSFTGRPAALLPSGDTPTRTAEDDAALLARLAGQLQGGLEVNPIRDTQLVELSYRSSSPELAARIANGYADAFIEWGVETRTTTVGRASTFLAKQIEALRGQIDELQHKLNAYSEESDFALDPAGEALLQRRETLEQQYNKVVGERITKESAYRETLNLSDELVANSFSGGRVSQLKGEIFQLQSDYDTKLGTYRPEWPGMVDLKKQIEEKRAELDRLIRETVTKARDQAYADYQKALGEEQALEAELRKLKNESIQLNSTALEYNNLKLDIETRKQLLNDLLMRQSETDVASRIQGSQESNVRIVDRAVVPANAFRPILESELSTALFVGLLLGVGAIFLLEYLDQTVKTPEELEALIGLPTLAVVPDIDEKRSSYGSRLGYARGYGYGYGYGYGANPKGPRAARRIFGRSAPRKPRRGKPAVADEKQIELLPHTHPRLAVCEAYRSLRTALLLSSTEELRVVALTSAGPGEGKTASTTNLGVVMAQLGRRVLVIDGDLRRPRMHKVFGVSNRLGLVSYLTGHVEIRRLLHETTVPNLYICASGPIPPNPSELLASERMRHFLSEARGHFDFILIDTPPALPVADAVILGTLADGVVICASAGMLVRDEAKACRERLRYADLRLLGTVLNRYRTGPARYNRRYQYYGVYERAPGEAKSTTAA